MLVSLATVFWFWVCVFVWGFFCNPQDAQVSVQVIDMMGAKSCLYSNGTHFVPAFRGYVNY